MTPAIRLFITDLDNTLYDWVEFFVPAIYALVDAAAPQLRCDRDELLNQLRSVHIAHRNSEHPFALLETPIVAARLPGQTRQERWQELGPAFAAFDEERRKRLRLYPGVAETLAYVRNTGCEIVAYTEAPVYNSLKRIRMLELQRWITHLYAPTGPALHPDASRVSTSVLPVNRLPLGHRKPDPTVVLDICRTRDVSPEETLYIGDSLVRDVAMANHAGVHSAWARYGTQRSPELWDRLVRITHWTNEDVAREADLRRRAGDIRPEFVVDSMSNLVQLCDFQPALDQVAAKAV